MKLSLTTRGFLCACALVTLGATLLTQCTSPENDKPSAPPDGSVKAKAETEALAAWDVIYRVLQHPRCMNCHPAGDAPLQGDRSVPHQQNVQRGEDGHGVFGMRCQTCHQEHNLIGEYLPPGGPDWHLPPPKMRLVFEGKSSGDLCRQLKDSNRNDHHTLQEILDHIEHAPLVLWGWDPGNGRTVPPISHAELVDATRAWIQSGCACPE